MKTNIKPCQGSILISEPFLKDFYFKRSVVLLAEHNENGTFGLVINKPTNLKLSDVLSKEDIEIPESFDCYLYLGGPVKTDSMFFIHTRNDLIDNSMKIIDGIYWGGNVETVNRLIKEQIIKPQDIRFYIGYSGWAPSQLDHELQQNSWVVSKATADFLLNSPPESMWKIAVKKLGKEYAKWVYYPLDPALN